MFFRIKKAAKIIGSPFNSYKYIKIRGLPLTRENDPTEIILTYASSFEGAFPSFDSGIMPSSSANTVEVTVTDSHRFPFRKKSESHKRQP